MNAALAVDLTQTRHYPVAGLVLAALVLAWVLLSILKESGETAEDGDGQRQKPTRLQFFRAALGFLAGATIFVLLFWQGPWWFDSLHIRKTKLGPADGVVITGFRTGLVALAAGLIAGAGLYYTHKKHQLEQQQFEHAQQQFAESQKQFETTVLEAQRRDERQAELTREGQVTGRYVEAIKLLAAEGAPEKLGGIYSLERIMRDSKRDRSTIAEVLAAYVRQRLDGSAPEIMEKRLKDEELAAARERGGGIGSKPSEPPLVPLPEDVRAALTVLSRNWEEAAPRADLRTLDLTRWDAREVQMVGVYAPGANLSSSELPGAALNRSDLHEAVLFNSNLANADLSHAELYDSALQGSKLSKAQLVGAILYDADLNQADARQANFTKADLSGAQLRDAQLQAATFSSANLEGARLTRARLAGADLATAHGVTPEQICRAYIYESTRLPAHIARHPWVQARISQCESGTVMGQSPPDWQEPSTDTSSS
ncbi:pentapeptide repeat-containing protein [Streptomyces canus]|uniref:pentapeptide repeat-containing protein n=1 Tax=Streptomyces canus TaxID=58343 RepID=UPI002E269375